MRIKMPITGTVKEVEPFISGDENDPIRMINLNLGDVSRKLIHLDIENEEMEIEVTASPNKIVAGVQVLRSQAEKDAILEHARGFSLERMSKQALYALSKSKALNNPFRKVKDNV